jgi:hypothetical protein
MQQRRFLGMPMGWDIKSLYPPRVMRGLWDASDERILRPRTFGIGWSVNFHALGRRLGLIRSTRR